jgi:hypothetical protein
MHSSSSGHTVRPHFGWLNHPTPEKEHGNGAEKSDEEEEEPFYWKKKHNAKRKTGADGLEEVILLSNTIC